MVSIGQRFGRLVAVEKIKGKPARWQCLCDCGKEHLIREESLLYARTKSCGCLIAEAARSFHRTHGATTTPEYHAWCHMLSRCRNPKNEGYHLYGGRGIQVCERWRKSFEHFFADMGKRPSPKHSIDRIDNDGNYEPSNCRWATAREQTRNKRCNHWVTFRGETKTFTDWARELGFVPETVRSRLSRGWSVEQALTLPANISASKRIRHEAKKSEILRSI